MNEAGDPKVMTPKAAFQCHPPSNVLPNILVCSPSWRSPPMSVVQMRHTYTNTPTHVHTRTHTRTRRCTWQLHPRHARPLLQLLPSPHCASPAVPEQDINACHQGRPSLSEPSLSGFCPCPFFSLHHTCWKEWKMVALRGWPPSSAGGHSKVAPPSTTTPFLFSTKPAPGHKSVSHERLNAQVIRQKTKPASLDEACSMLPCAPRPTGL